MQRTVNFFKRIFWLKVFYHNYTGIVLFKNEEEALLTNSPQKYSILSHIGLTNKINENRRLKKRIKEIQDSRYLMSCTVKINDTIPFASLMHEIDEYTIRNENRRRKIKRKEKNLLKVLSENGMKLIDGKYIQISNPSFHNDQLSNREKSLIQFIERSQNISAKVDEIKQKLDFKLSPIIYKSLLTEWSEFIDKQISYMT